MAEKKKSKRYRSLVKDFDKNNSLKIEEAVKVIKEKSKAKFVESFDVCFSLAVDKTKPDSVLRTTVDLPNGNGKKIKIAVFINFTNFNVESIFEFTLYNKNDFIN